MKYKTLINPSFLVITLELQDALLEGWRIDPDNLPVNNFTYSEIHLVKDNAEDVVEVFEDTTNILHTDEKNNDFGSTTVKKKAGRPAQKDKV